MSGIARSDIREMTIEDRRGERVGGKNEKGIPCCLIFFLPLHVCQHVLLLSLDSKNTVVNCSDFRKMCEAEQNVR